MPTFLSDPPRAQYAILILAVLCVFGVWFRYRKRMTLLAAVGVAVLLLLMLLADRFFESPREQAVRRVEEMAAALTGKNWAKFAEHVSDSFDMNGMKKGDLKKKFDLGLQYNVRVAVWDGVLAEPVTYTADTVIIQFEAKAESPSGQMFKHFEAKFTKDPDEQFRMRSFIPFNYVQKKVVEPIPGVP